MSFLLDTNICSAYLRHPGSLFHRFTQHYGRLRGEHLRRGISFSPIDLMIASTAFAHDLTLVTHNVKDFERVPDLRIEDWIQG